MQYLLRTKVTAALFLSFLVPLVGKAQLRSQLNQDDHDDKLYHFGINIGMNKSHFNFTHNNQFLGQDSVMSIESINSTGINLAWLVNLRLGEHFDLRTYPLNLTFSEKAFEYNLKYPDLIGGEGPLTLKKVQSITLSLPFMIKFSSDRINNLKVYTLTGGRFDYDLASNANKRNAEQLIKIKPYDYSIEAGIGFHIYFPYFVLSPELRVNWGLSNLHSRNADLKFSSNVDQIRSRMISFSLTVE
ncbi:MAG: hypothetical protein RLY16_579 [Bacteroidota bacterium]|jgi:Outer membrane protein beta-barrel domain